MIWKLGLSIYRMNLATLFLPYLIIRLGSGSGHRRRGVDRPGMRLSLSGFEAFTHDIHDEDKMQRNSQDYQAYANVVQIMRQIGDIIDKALVLFDVSKTQECSHAASSIW